MKKENVLFPLLAIISFLIIMFLSRFLNLTFKQIMSYSFILVAILLVLGYEYATLKPLNTQKTIVAYFLMINTNMIIALFGVYFFPIIDERPGYILGVYHFIVEGLIVGIACEIINKLIKILLNKNK